MFSADGLRDSVLGDDFKILIVIDATPLDRGCDKGLRSLAGGMAEIVALNQGQRMSTAVVSEGANVYRVRILVAGFLAWMFAGLENSLFILIHRQMMLELLGPATPENVVTQWFAFNQAAFMLGAAAGGWLFGALGDRYGRTRALAWSVLCYSLLTLAAWFVTDARLMWTVRFLACLGFGGTWPNAVALVSEAWPAASKPLMAGVMGTAANFGFVLLGVIGLCFEIRDDSWRWVLLVGASPAVIGVWIAWSVPESTKWLASQSPQPVPSAAANTDIARLSDPVWEGSNERQQVRGRAPLTQGASGIRPLFQRPLLQRTLLGIALGAVPVVGTAANANWVVPWTDQVAAREAKKEEGVSSASKQEGRSAGKPQKPKQGPKQKALAQITRSSGAIVGSLLGGVIASFVGRRLTYFLISLATFGASTMLFGALSPGQPWFGTATFLLGLFGVTYFGWLPLFLPELFPTSVRAAGSGISFNSGRIIAAGVVLYVGLRMDQFAGDYGRIGLWSGMIYVVGMIIIWFAPAKGRGVQSDTENSATESVSRQRG